MTKMSNFRLNKIRCDLEDHSFEKEYFRDLISKSNTKTLCITDSFSFLFSFFLSFLDVKFQAFKASGDMTISGEPNYTINTLIGKRDDPILTIYARQIIELVGNTSSKPILLAVALVDESKETLRTILEILGNNKVW